MQIKSLVQFNNQDPMLICKHVLWTLIFYTLGEFFFFCLKFLISFSDGGECGDYLCIVASCDRVGLSCISKACHWKL